MRSFLKHLIKIPLRFLFLIRPKNNMSNHFYRARWFLMGQIQKLMMGRVRKEAYKGHIIEFICPNYLSDWRAQTFNVKEPETLEWIDTMKDEEIFWDVGANIGVFSLYAAKAKNANVFSFEPSVFNLELLTRNIFQNQLQDRISVVPIALTNNTGFNNMYMTTTEWGGALTTFGEDFGWDGKKLNQNFKYITAGITMDDAVNKLKIPLPSYLKMDVDGLEHIILQGGDEVLKNVESILIEVNENFEEQNFKVQQILTDAGLTLIHKKISSSEFSEPSELQAQATYNQIWKKNSYKNH